MKRKLALFLAVVSIACVLGSVCVNAGIMWTNISDANVYFTASSAEGYVFGVSGTTNITATLAVYRQNSYGGWDYVSHTGGATSSSSYYLTVPFTPVSGGYYKAVLNATVTANGTSENTIQTAYRQY